MVDSTVDTAPEVGKMYVARQDIVASDIGGDWALLDMESSLYYTLNETGATVWNAMQAPATLDALVSVVTEHFSVSDEVCRPDVEALLADLVKSGLVTISGA
jgi:hypothetical protein